MNTSFLVAISTKIGHRRPDSVPTPFEIPIKIPAYRGAMSRWLTLKPEKLFYLEELMYNVRQV